MNLLEESLQKSQESSLELVKSYKATFNSPSGQRVLEDLAKLAAIGIPTGPLSVEEANYINGAQSIYHRIISLVNKKL
nr:MAG TPA: hypothetical protein [Caudoviricetes sp.]